MDSPDNIHEGHRAKMRARFFESGLRGFAPHEVIEFLLYYTIPRKNTNEIAHALINKFGSIAGVFDATIPELTDAGLSENSIALFKAITQSLSLYYQSENKSRVYDNTQKIREMFATEFPGRNVEEFRLACFNNKLQLKDKIHIISAGTFAATAVNMRRLVETVIKEGSYCIAISHNHPNALPTPSNEDIAATRYILQTLRAIEVHLLDHVIIGLGPPYSMRDNDVFSIFE
jgi:DNA repair protein RadC